MAMAVGDHTLGDKAETQILEVAFESTHWPGNFLSLNGSGVTAKSAGGQATGSKTIGKNEHFVIENDYDRSMLYIRSIFYPTVYMSAEGAGVHLKHQQEGNTQEKDGVIGGREGKGENERFRLVNQDDETKAIESIPWPGCFLSYDANEGKMFLQTYVGTWERFKVHVL